MKNLVQGPLQVAVKIRKIWRVSIGRIVARQKIRRRPGGPIRLILGAGHVRQDGWISVEHETFDLRDSSDKIGKLLRGQKISRILLEHVIEHLQPEALKNFLMTIRPFLSSDAVIRIAVPDRLHPSRYFYEYAKPGGFGSGAADHKHFYSINDFQEFSRESGWGLEPVEYFDNSGTFHSLADHLENDRGRVSRSAMNYKGEFARDSSAKVLLLNTIENLHTRNALSAAGITMTSLIVDLKPPA
jgi:predicted SAM-dependent methyltransferase